MLNQRQSPRDIAWHTMLVTKEFTLLDIQKSSGMSSEQAMLFISQLMDENVISFSSYSDRHYIVINKEYWLYNKVKQHYHKKPNSRAGKNRQNIWLTMRVLRNFELKDLMIAAEAKAPAVRRYLNQLKKINYIRRYSNVPATKNVKTRYILIKNTGPLAPIERTGIGMWDPNTEQLITFKQEASNEPRLD